MPRRNLIVLLLAAAVSLACYLVADHSQLSRSFAQISNIIEHRYVDRVDRQTLWAAAVRGMISKLGDPYSEYIEPAESAQLDKELNQQFAGIGVVVVRDPESSQPRVLTPIADSPASRAGIEAGDIITKIDGRSTAGMKFEEATQRLHGPLHTEVQLSVQRGRQSGEITLPPIRREVVQVDSVLGDTRDKNDHWNFLLSRNPNIGYVRIVEFGEHTVEEFQAALEQLKANHLEGLILDLRDNPGGLVPAAIGVCGLLLPPGEEIVSVEGREPNSKLIYESTAGPKFLDFPLVVLVNGYSASAAEIVAACLQDQHRATIVGQRTWGKGTVQTIIPLGDKHGELKLTTAAYLRPNGHNIHKRPGDDDSKEWGVLPDAKEQVKMTDDDWRRWRDWRQDRDILRPQSKKGAEAAAGLDVDHDPPLAKAVDFLKSELTGGGTVSADTR